MTRQRALVNKTLKLSLWNSIYFRFKSFYFWMILFFLILAFKLSPLYGCCSQTMLITDIIFNCWIESLNSFCVIIQPNYHDLYLCQCLRFVVYFIFNYCSQSTQPIIIIVIIMRNIHAWGLTSDEIDEIVNDMNRQ